MAQITILEDDSHNVSEIFKEIDLNLLSNLKNYLESQLIVHYRCEDHTMVLRVKWWCTVGELIGFSKSEIFGDKS